MSASNRATRERGHSDMTSRPYTGRLTVVVEPNEFETEPDESTPGAEELCATTEHEEPRNSVGESERAAMPVRGPLLAVCGLCGGAGASTLAYLVALAAAREGPGLVLVGDTGGPSGGLSHYIRVAAPRSLVEAAELVARGLPTGQLVARTSDGLRVLATGPRFALECARDGVELLLDHARERYALTVIDCGTLAREADQVALAKASHVAWVLPATDGAVRRVRGVLEAVNPLRGTELIVARHEERQPKAAVRELRRLAEHRRATLVLAPSLPDLAGGDVDRALDLGQVSLQAIRGVLRR
jgi:Flp pilus assembly CpaE family ATPase